MRPPRYYDQDFMAQRCGSHYQGSTERAKGHWNKRSGASLWKDEGVRLFMLRLTEFEKKNPTVFQSMNTEDLCAFTEIVK